MLIGNVLDDVLVETHVIGHRHEIVIFEVDFRLASRRDLMVLCLDLQAAVDHGLHHLVANIHELIGWRHGEISLFMPKLVAQIGIFVGAPIPLAFATVDKVPAAVGALIETDIVEDKKILPRGRCNRCQPRRCSLNS